MFRVERMEASELLTIMWRKVIVVALAVRGDIAKWNGPSDRKDFLMSAIWCPIRAAQTQSAQTFVDSMMSSEDATPPPSEHAAELLLEAAHQCACQYWSNGIIHNYCVFLLRLTEKIEQLIENIDYDWDVRRKRNSERVNEKTLLRTVVQQTQDAAAAKKGTPQVPMLVLLSGRKDLALEVFH